MTPNSNETTENVSNTEQQKTESVKLDSKPKKMSFFGVSYGLDESQDENVTESTKKFTPGSSKL